MTHEAAGSSNVTYVSYLSPTGERSAMWKKSCADCLLEERENYASKTVRTKLLSQTTPEPSPSTPGRRPSRTHSYFGFFVCVFLTIPSLCLSRSFGKAMNADAATPIAGGGSKGIIRARPLSLSPLTSPEQHNTSFLQNTGFKVIARPTQHRKLNNEGLVEFHHQVSAALSLECMQNETGRLALHDAEGEEV